MIIICTLLITCIFFIVLSIIVILLKIVNDFTAVILFISILCVISTLICLPVNRMSNRVKMVQYEAIKITITTARKQENQIELTALTQNILEINQNLTAAKYWNNTWLFGGFTVDEYAKLPLLK